MAENKGKVKVSKPTSVWAKPLKVSFKDLFKSLGKAVAHGATLNWVEVTKNTIDALSAVGIEKDAGQIAWQLIHRSVVQAIFTLVEENLTLIKNSPTGLWNLREQEGLSVDDFNKLCEKLDASLEQREIFIDDKFFTRPEELPVIKDILGPFAQWLEGVGLVKAQAEVISERLPSYFVYALANEWRTRREQYSYLKEAFDTPFTQASEREQAWACYAAWLQRQVEVPLFSEAFGLKHVYVPIRAFYEQKAQERREPHAKRTANLEEESLDEWAKALIGEQAKTETQADDPPADDADTPEEERFERVVVNLEAELEEWVGKSDPQEAVRVISGGPGSGKSSFAKMFAAKQAEKPTRRVLFIPLHRFDPTDDLIEAVQDFIELDGFLTHNPLHPKNGDSRLLIIFDGLDELSMQGKLASEVAQHFVQEVQRKVDRVNIREARLKVLITGRELSVQANISNFRKPEQVLQLLPYYVDGETSNSENPFQGGSMLADTIRLLIGHELLEKSETWKRGTGPSEAVKEIIRAYALRRIMVGGSVSESKEEAVEIIEDVKPSKKPRTIYYDEQKLLRQDQRHLWWIFYGKASGRRYSSMPKELRRKELREVTSQPLLNYLVALSFDRGTLDFSEESNINIIYADLLKSVHQRVWANYQHPALGDLQQDQYLRILEEIAVATWHGDGRSTTLKQIEKQCDGSGLRLLLEKFKEGAKESVSRLLMAFYFRQSARRASYEETFEFTHKSFGEYLTAKRIVRSIQLMHDAIERRVELLESGWDERDALTYWLNICGPVPLDDYLHKFIENEVGLCSLDTVKRWQETIAHLIAFSLDRGMPTERLEPRPVYREESRWARNAEEALLVLLDICARRSQQRSEIKWPAPAAFSEWLARLHGQRKEYENGLALRSLNYLDLSECVLILKDLFGANLLKSSFRKANLYEANLAEANLEEAIFNEANLSQANLQRAYLIGSSCEGANFSGANLQEALLQEVNFKWAIFKGATLKKVNAFRTFFDEADLENANLEEAILSGASLQRTNLQGANLSGAQLRGASLRQADLRGANLQGAYLAGANLEGANLDGANLLGAYIYRAYFEGATMSSGVWVNGETRP